MNTKVDQPVSNEQLRVLVREVIRDIFPSLLQPKAAQGEVVSIQSDADLANLVKRIVQLLDNPKLAESVRSGAYIFTLAKQPNAAQDAVVVAATHLDEKSSLQINDGVLTEVKVAGYKGKVARLVLGPTVVLTPGARDKAQQLGITIERRKP